MRIVASGSGIVSSIGCGLPDFERALYAGLCGIGPKTLFETDEDPEAPAAEVRNFVPQTWLGNKGIRVLDRSARLLSCAAWMALDASRLLEPDAAEADPGLGLVCGTLFGSVHSIVSFDWSGLVDGPKYVNPMEFPNTVINSPAGQAAIKHRLRGINSTISAGLASGLYALHYAAEFLRLGRARTLLAGGVEELCQESYLAFRKLNLTSPSGRLRPFAPDRDGTVPGEGSALLALETEEAALQRGVEPLCQVCGFGAGHDAYSTQAYQVRGEGAARAIRQSLENSGIEPHQVALIVASANGSPAGDEMELRALRRVFGEHLERISVCAPKASLGEALGASGAFLAVTAGLALSRQMAPPTVGLDGGEQGLRLSPRPQPVDGDFALVSCLSCDGNNSALVIKRWSGPEGD